MTRIVAHRGGALLWPENSLAAFRGALGLGVDAVELDVHTSRDDEVVVIHDPTLDRTTTGQGPVAARGWAELEGVLLRDTAGERLPRLREVLDLVVPSPVEILVEIKVDAERRPYPGIEARVLALLAEAGLMGRAGVLAFDWTSLERMRGLSREVRLTGLLNPAGVVRLGGIPAAAARLASLGAHHLAVGRTLLAAETIAAVRAAGLGLGVWTVNEPEEIGRALALGVDYLITDRPDRALQLRAAAA